MPCVSSGMVKVTFNAVSVVTWSVKAANVCVVVTESSRRIVKIPQVRLWSAVQSSVTVNVTASSGFVFNLSQ